MNIFEQVTILINILKKKFFLSSEIDISHIPKNKNNDFENAVFANNLIKVRKYLKDGYDVNSFPQYQFMKAIYLANKQDILGEILLCGYDKSNLTNDGFLYLIDSNQEKILHFFIARGYPLDKFTKDIFLDLVSKNRFSTVGHLLDKGYQINTFIGEVFSIAIKKRSDDVLNTLVRDNYSVNECYDETFIFALSRVNDDDKFFFNTVTMFLRNQYTASKVKAYFDGRNVPPVKREQIIVDYIKMLDLKEPSKEIDCEYDGDYDGNYDSDDDGDDDGDDDSDYDNTPCTNEEFSDAVLSNNYIKVLKYLKDGYETNNITEELMLHMINLWNPVINLRIFKLIIRKNFPLDKITKDTFLAIVSLDMDLIVELLLNRGYFIKDFIREIFSTAVLECSYEVVRTLISKGYTTKNCNKETFFEALENIDEERFFNIVKLLLQNEYPSTTVFEYFYGKRKASTQRPLDLFEFMDNHRRNYLKYI
jgi:hypothetical protein